VARERGGGYGGDALSLRKTELTREQIAETVGCGRPGTGMPFFTRGAYDTIKCYDMNRHDAGSQMPPEANTFLRPNDIEAVADYVIAHIKGKGEPNYAECVGFLVTLRASAISTRRRPSRPQIPPLAQERRNDTSTAAIDRDVGFHLSLLVTAAIRRQPRPRTRAATTCATSGSANRRRTCLTRAMSTSLRQRSRKRLTTWLGWRDCPR